MKSLKRMLTTVEKGVSKHLPEILMGFGLTGMVSATVLAIKSTPKALLLIDNEARKRVDEKKEQADDILYEPPTTDEVESEKESMSTVDVVKITLPCYIPSIIMGGFSIVCMISSNSVNIKRNKALATAYGISASALEQYQKKVIETIGEEKEQAIQNAVAADTIKSYPLADREIVHTRCGDVICFEPASCRYFWSSANEIKRIENELNKRMIDETFVSLNDFYYEIGLPQTCIGDDLGWDIYNGYIDIYFSSQITDDDKPCLVLNYRVTPRYDYR